MADANANTRAAVARRKNPTPDNTGNGDLRALIERQKPEFARALTGTALEPERFTRILLTVVRQSPQLQRCRPDSVLGCGMESARLGLEPGGPLQEAHIVPYGDEATFIVGYQGLIKLAFQSGQIRHIDADVVHENDQFDYAKGAEPRLSHVPALSGRGGVYCYYAVASFKNGGHVAVVLSPEDVNKVRDRSPSARSKQSPWQTDYDAMAIKTCVRRLAKFLPMATDLARAVAADETPGSAATEAADDLAELTIEPDEPEPEPATAEQATIPEGGSDGESN